MTVWPTADFWPDSPAYKSQNSEIAKGCYPAPAGYDAPLQAAVTQGVSVTSSAVIGAVTMLDNSGTSYMFAGTQADLYLYNAGAGTWTNKSNTAAGHYSTPTNRFWKFCQFGERIIAANGDAGDALQVGVLPVGGRFADLAAGAPTARYVATIEPGFVMAGFIANGALGTLGGGVGWCGFNDATNWPTWGTAAAAAAQSDYQNLQGGGNVKGIIPAIGGAQGVVLTDRAAFRIEYVGPPSIFAFRQIDFSRGCLCPQGIASFGTQCWYISEDGFIQFDGSTFKPIGYGRVDNFFFNEVDQTKFDNVYATVDFNKKCIIWAYPTTDATSGTTNRWLIYSYAKDRWRYCDDASIVAEFLMPARTAGYTLDTMDTIFSGGPDASGTFTVDDATYQGGTRTLSGFNSSHKMVFFNGSNLAATIETGESDFDGTRAFVTAVRPMTDSTNITARIGCRDTLTGGLSYTTATGIGKDATCPQRISARYARVRVQIPAAETWSYFLGADITSRPEGKR